MRKWPLLWKYSEFWEVSHGMSIHTSTFKLSLKVSGSLTSSLCLREMMNVHIHRILFRMLLNIQVCKSKTLHTLLSVPVPVSLVEHHKPDNVPCFQLVVSIHTNRYIQFLALWCNDAIFKVHAQEACNLVQRKN